MRRGRRLVEGMALLVAAMLLPTAAAAQEVDGALLLIMDASGSMEATDADGVRLIDGAKDALRGVVDALPDGTHVGLRVYGHREPNTDEEAGCQDTELVSPVQPLDREAMHAAIDEFEPSGFTPIGLSLEQAVEDLPPEGPRTIILVSDGEDTCSPPDPCEVAADLRRDGVDLVIETVGFALGDNDAARQQLSCIAEAGGGEFRDIATAAELAEQLEVVSVREARRYSGDGVPIEGAPFTDDAPTMELGTTYLDTVQTGEILYYRVEAPAGAVLDARVVRGLPTDSDFGNYGTFFYVYFTNADDTDDERFEGGYNAPRAREVQARPFTGFELEGEPGDLVEAFVKVEIRPYNNGEVAEFPVELLVEAQEGTIAEPVDETPTEEPEEPAPDETDEPTDEPTAEVSDEPVAAPADGGDGGVPGWAVAVIALLALLVLGLGAVVVMLMRRQTPAGTPPPPA